MNTKRDYMLYISEVMSKYPPSTMLDYLKRSTGGIVYVDVEKMDIKINEWMSLLHHVYKWDYSDTLSDVSIYFDVTIDSIYGGIVNIRTMCKKNCVIIANSFGSSSPYIYTAEELHDVIKTIKTT